MLTKASDIRPTPRRNKKRGALLALCGATIALGLWALFGRGPQLPETSEGDSPMSRPPISYKPTTAKLTEGELLIPPENTEESRSAMKFLNAWMQDSVFRTFFYYTHEFFDNKPEAFPAARFVSLTLLFDESTENFYLMQWTQEDLKRYSNEIMSTLETKRREIDANPYFHNRMLNLVNQLEIPPERRLAFWGDTIQQPIVLLKNGELDDSSHNFETALLLAQQDDESGNSIAPYLQKLLDATPGSAEFSAIKERVETFFPHLGWMFAEANRAAR